ncbi:TonB-dependent receptor [Dysgonomonas capnocytophagoides]|uniref:TonB-dependent receptor n=1 Tax=Dysgonomonas capnocytophagoides TaxID=45254 RepID=UPI00291D99FC|nr:TonB-dependent receptor [Dysgonomonas capnocytophagoides]
MYVFTRVFLLFMFSLLLILEAYAQTSSINIEMKNATLKEITNQIEQKSNYSFVFNENLNMQQQKDISIHYKSISEALKQVFGGTGISWQIVDSHIVLSKAKMITISGYVTDANSKETLIGATISDKRSEGNSSTNSYGYYSTQVMPDSVQMQVSYIGYRPSTKNLYALSDTIVNFGLNESISELQSVIVYNIKPLSRVGNTIELSGAEIKSSAATFGENDILKSLQTMPGISSGFEGSSGMYVRGGSPDQNLILLDGTPIYNTGHMWNLFSVLNGDAVKKATLYKNNFPARFGGRLSSVLDVRFKDGDMQRFHVNATIGLYTARINIEGPILKDKTSYSLSVRRSYIDTYLRIAQKTSPGIDVVYMYDINAKINHKFSDRSRLYLNYYSGRDKQNNKEVYESHNDNGKISDSNTKNNYSWGNDILSLRWNYLFNNRLFMNASVAYNRYDYSYESRKNQVYHELEQGYDIFKKSGIKDWQSDVDFDFQLNNNHYLRFGTGLISHQFKPETHGSQMKNSNESSENWDSKYFLREKIDGTEMSLYGEDEFSISEKLKANLGLHFSIFNVQGKTYTGLQPRISVSYQLAHNLVVNSSYSRMNQYVNLLSSNTVNDPTDLWVPITKNLQPMSSDQLTVGLFLDRKNGYNFSLESFYKKMNNILEYKDGLAWKDIFTPWEENIEAGEGKVYGLELFARKTNGRFTGSLGYTLSWNNRRFPTINKGRQFPSKYDSRHKINITTNYKLSNKIDITAAWVYSTGTRATLPLEQYQGLPQLDNSTLNNLYSYYNYFSYNNYINYFGERNNYKMSDIHHLDLEMRYQRSARKIWTFGVYNIYNKVNPYMARVGSNDSGKPIVIEKALFGIMPSISFTYKFR